MRLLCNRKQESKYLDDRLFRQAPSKSSALLTQKYKSKADNLNKVSCDSLSKRLRGKPKESSLGTLDTEFHSLCSIPGACSQLSCDRIGRFIRWVFSMNVKKMKGNNNLHRLIQSLNKAEKRNFKMMIAQHMKKESSNYILLFDAIDRQEVYDEFKLKQKFRKHHFGKNISKTKYMLYRQVLKSLRLLNDTKTPRTLVASYLSSVATLYSKCLYEQCGALLKKAYGVAESQEFYDQLLEITNWEEKLLPYLTLEAGEEYDLLAQRKQSLQLQQAREFSLRSHWTRAQRISSLPEEVQAKNWTALMGKVASEANEEEESFLSSVFRLSITALNAHYKGDQETAVQCLVALFDKWHSDPERIIGNEDDYIWTCTPFVMSGTDHMDLVDRFDMLFENLQSSSHASAKMQEKFRFMAVVLEFIQSLSTCQIERCKLLLISIEMMQADQLNAIPRAWQLRLYYYVGIYFFLEGNYAEAIEWVERVEKAAVPNTQPSMLGYCKLVSLMAKYEIKSYSNVMEYDIRKTYRYLKKRKQFWEVERLVLNSVKRLLYANHVKETQGIFANLCESIQNVERRKIPVFLVTSNAIYQWASHKLTDPNQRIIN